MSLNSLVRIEDYLYPALSPNQVPEVALQALRQADTFLDSQERFWASWPGPAASSHIVSIMFSLARSVVKWHILQNLEGLQSARGDFLTAAARLADTLRAAADAEVLHLWFDAGVTKVSGMGLCLYNVSSFGPFTSIANDC